jgi:hypothetical protein
MEGGRQLLREGVRFVHKYVNQPIRMQDLICEDTDFIPLVNKN